MFSQTDLNLTYRYKFGSDSQFTMAFDLNFLNLWDQATVTGIYTTMNPSTAPVNAAALGLSQVQYATGLTSGSLLNQIFARIASCARQERHSIQGAVPLPATQNCTFWI